MVLFIRLWATAVVAFMIWCTALPAAQASSIPYIYTETPQYDSSAAAKGGERFPSGATLRIVENDRVRPLVPGFAASIDASVSFDARRVLFAGKQKASDHWQIWEVEIGGGAPRRLVNSDADSITPFYLPEDRIVYSRRTAVGYQLMAVSLRDGQELALTYGPGNHIANDVLRDGRILYEAPHGSGSSDLYTVYSDGSGVETYRCDHGADRRAGRQVASGDIVFETAGRLGRFTSSRATALDLSLPAGTYAGPIAEGTPGDWLAAWRPDAKSPFAIYHLHDGTNVLEKVRDAGGRQAIQPILVMPRPMPNRHPSGLGNREGANLLCLSVYTSRQPIARNAVRSVRVWALDGSASTALGTAPVASDGSFFTQVPGETPIRFELLDAAGKTIAAEKTWFWSREGEQRVCVGCHAGPERAPENAVPETLLLSTDPVKMLLPVHTAKGGAK